MQTCDLQYDLPEALIAQQPPARRRDSRLLVLDRSTQRLEHRHFADLGDYLQPGDCLVLNDSKVLPAKFRTRRPTGGLVEGLFLKLTPEGYWETLLRKASRLKQGELLTLEQHSPTLQASPTPHNGHPVKLRVVKHVQEGAWWLAPQDAPPHLHLLERYGWTPLPPYIHRKTPDDAQDRLDRQRYQTVYAAHEGSVAAPTAGLHFDQALLDELAAKGVLQARVRLHVGLGTFQAVTAESVEDHPMHAEYYEIEPTEAQRINDARAQGRRVVAVGTTAVRVLETVARQGRVQPGSGWTQLLITPPYQFQATDALVTNFHLPRTTLLALVCALGGTKQVLEAYQEAVRLQYRFYSYGDAMVVI